MINPFDIINTAKSLKNKGIKYSFGSTNIEGGSGDCSSFTQYVYRKNGILIGRDTQAQYTSKLGKSVDKNNLAIGDLVFFKFLAVFTMSKGFIIFLHPLSLYHF